MIPESELETRVVLGGHSHYVYAGGPLHSRTILLLCHGGPGFSELPMIRAGTYRRLQQHLTLVTWDQRGTARSYCDRLETESLTVNRILEDAGELLDWLPRNFECDRIHVLGHSWGGCLAILLAAMCPDRIASLFALCPFISMMRSTAAVYPRLLARAAEQGNSEALADLRQLGPPPYVDLHADLAIHSRWVMALGGMVFGGPERIQELFGLFAAVPGYTTADLDNARKGQKYSGLQLLSECATLDLFERVSSLDLPVTVLLGRHDLLNAASVAAEWYEKLSAPQKKIVWFEQSGHFPNFDQPEAFQTAILAGI